MDLSQITPSTISATELRALLNDSKDLEKTGSQAQGIEIEFHIDPSNLRKLQSDREQLNRMKAEGKVFVSISEKEISTDDSSEDGKNTSNSSLDPECKPTKAKAFGVSLEASRDI
jgi:hypothetical protein